jgi:GMP synthase (glutamine-hydrolysing)
LLGGFQGPFKAHMCHRQSVVELPKGAVPLAATRKEGCAAFSLNACAWGVQFHPEFDGRIAKAYAMHCLCELTEHGADVDQILTSCMDTGSGREIFGRFLAVVAERDAYLHAQKPFAHAM